jgi:RNA polymerase sigma factor (sigma-70 family)
MCILYEKCLEPNFALTSSAKTYLYAVVRNLWREKLRNKTKGSLDLRLDDPGGSHEVVDLSDDFSIELSLEEDATEEDLSHFRIVFKQLSEDCRHLLRDFYVYRIKLKQLEAEKGLSDGYLKVKKNRCMKRLRNLFLSKRKHHGK